MKRFVPIVGILMLACLGATPVSQEDRIKALEAEVSQLAHRVAILEAQAKAKPPAPAVAASESPAVSAPNSTPAVQGDKHQMLGTYGNIKVEVTDYGVSTVPLSYLGKDSESNDQLLWVKIRISNMSATKKEDYKTWRGQDFNFGRDYANATDNFGNSLKRINFGLATFPKGAPQHGDSIYPHKTLDEVLVFEKPIDGTKTIKIDMPQNNIGGNGDNISFDLTISK